MKDNNDWGKFCLTTAFVKQMTIHLKFTSLGVNLLIQAFQECFKGINMTLNDTFLTPLNSPSMRNAFLKKYAFPACQQKPVPQGKVITSCLSHYFYCILHQTDYKQHYLDLHYVHMGLKLQHDSFLYEDLTEPTYRKPEYLFLKQDNPILSESINP